MKVGLLVAGVITLGGCVATSPYVPIEQTNLVEIEGLTQKQLYDNARQWFSQYFVSGESVVDYEDPSTGTIIGNGIADNGTDMLGVIPYKFRYNIRVDTKDGKLRVVTKIIEHYMVSDGNKKKVFAYVNDELKQKAKVTIDKVVNNLESYIQKTQSNDDW
jgi:hypothetical protein